MKKNSATKYPILVGLSLGLFISLGVVGIREAGWLQSAELKAYDFCIWAFSRHNKNDSKIVLIRITEEDINYLRRWPITDEILAELIEKIASLKPRVIGVDIYRNIPIPPGADRLERLIDGISNVIFIEKFGDDTEKGIPPPSGLEGSDRVGFNDIIVDNDGVVRRALLFLDDGKRLSTSFTLRLAQIYLHQENIDPQPGQKDPSHLRLGKTTFQPFETNDGGYINADARGYQYLIDFKIASPPVKIFSLKEALTGKLASEDIVNNIVIVGVTAKSVKDTFLVPLGAGAIENGWVYGVELHGLLTDQIIRSALTGMDTVKSFDDHYEWMWILIWGIFGCVLTMTPHPLWIFMLIASGGVFAICALGYLIFNAGFWVPIVPPMLAWLCSTSIMTAYTSRFEKAQRDVLMRLFSRHVSRDIANEIWNQRDRLMNGGRPLSQKLIATVLFTDLKGFTSVSEKLQAEALMEWLNEYMDAMTSIILQNGGVVDKYIGDAIMAVFGIPVARALEAEIRDDAINAVKSALKMGDELVKLHYKWKEKGLPLVKMRVGIFTGPLVAGGLGSAERMDYTVIGDTVNTASRLESYGKDDHEMGEMACRILIGESTHKYLDNRFKTRHVGSASLKGKDEAINVYLVLPPSTNQEWS